jgi:hypothetical protein
MDRAKIKPSSSSRGKEEQSISNLLDTIEKGDIPNELFICRLLDMVIELNNKIDNLGQKILHLSDINKKINEIHILHFPKEHFQTDKTLREKYLAEIILGIPKKRKT